MRGQKVNLRGGYPAPRHGLRSRPRLHMHVKDMWLMEVTAFHQFQSACSREVHELTAGAVKLPPVMSGTALTTTAVMSSMSPCPLFLASAHNVLERFVAWPLVIVGGLAAITSATSSGGIFSQTPSEAMTRVLPGPN